MGAVMVCGFSSLVCRDVERRASPNRYPVVCSGPDQKRQRVAPYGFSVATPNATSGVTA
jgi:hypothetical protein